MGEEATRLVGTMAHEQRGQEGEVHRRRHQRKGRDAPRQASLQEDRDGDGHKQQGEESAGEGPRRLVAELPEAPDGRPHRGKVCDARRSGKRGILDEHQQREAHRAGERQRAEPGRRLARAHGVAQHDDEPHEQGKADDLEGQRGEVQVSVLGEVLDNARRRCVGGGLVAGDHGDDQRGHEQEHGCRPRQSRPSLGRTRWHVGTLSGARTT